MEKPEDYPATPNLDKMLAVRDESEVLTRFVDWLNDERNYHICEKVKFDEHGGDDCEGHMVYADYGDYNRLFADFFGIDYGEMERERRAVLKFVQVSNA